MVFAIAAAWVAFGIAAALVMHRRGHDTFSWAVLFIVLGPLALPVAVSVDRHPPPEPEPPGGNRSGALDALVAHDGTAPADAALDAALSVFGAALTSVTIAAVVDAEAVTTVRGRTTIEEAERRLSSVARRAADVVQAPVDTIVLHGEPAHTLERFAADHGYEVIVAGSHCATSKRLAAGSSVPVLIGPAVRT